ncbi:hypothetical protein Tco_0232309 [Tanacetum coccineum]
MDLETAQNNAVAKLPILKQGDYETWRLRIEQYFEIQDYALWDIIENDNSFNPVARTTTNADGTSTSTIPGAVTTKEKDAKTLFKAIQTRFGGNNATKKTQKTLLKQMYENFNAPSIESLDSIFNTLQKIISQLASWVETSLKRSQFKVIKGIGYNAVPPPPTGLFSPPTIDLSNSGLKEFQQPEFGGYGFKVNKGVCENSLNEIKKTADAPIIKDWVSDCDKDDYEVMLLKSDNVQHKPEQANQPKKVSQNLSESYRTNLE